MINVAIIAGGFSGEFEISMKSAMIVAQYIPSEKYKTYIIEISADGWCFQTENKQKIAIDKNDFSLSLAHKKICFDIVFNAIHGTPGEDGKILAYFEMLGIPFTSSSSISSALTFNKAYCNQLVRNYSLVRVANSIHLFKGKPYKAEEILSQIKLPCFVKPNQGGSSVGMTKVIKTTELLPSVDKAFREDDEVLIEEYIEGRELTMGAMMVDGHVIKFPVTEIKSKRDFFDFEAKYNPALNEEITPASIPDVLKNKIESASELLYKNLNLKGVVRFDFINNSKGLYFLEVNTVPGLSAESIVPKQLRYMGWTLSDLFEKMILESMSSN
jgi:D-alanine-D-alanine ligase